MLAFLTKEVELKGEYDIVYIFNNKPLYDKLSKKFNCVNIARNGKAKEFNFKKEIVLKDYEIIDIQKSVYFYLKKRNKVYCRSKKDFNMQMLYELQKQNRTEHAQIFMQDAIKGEMRDIYSMYFGKSFLTKYQKHIEILFNYVETFYSAYAHRFGYSEKIEVLKYALFLNILLYYTFNQYDVNETGFKRGYLKIISRLFVEQIHKRELTW